MVDGTPTLGEDTEGDVWKEITSRLWEDWMGGAWMKKAIPGVDHER